MSERNRFNVNYVANALLTCLKWTNIWHQFMKEIIKSILKFDKSSRIVLVYLQIIPVRTFYYKGIHPVLSIMHEDICCKISMQQIFGLTFFLKFHSMGSGFMNEDFVLLPTYYGAIKLPISILLSSSGRCSLKPSQPQGWLFRVIVWSLWTVFSQKKR